MTPTFASGSLAESVHFVTVGSTLTITLTNTSGADVGVPADVLTAMFFSCTGCGTLTTVSANTSGPTYVDAAIATVGANGFNGATGLNVGGEWAYATGIGGAPGGATQGISSSGFNFFGGGNFNGTNLEGPNAVNGLNFGIVPNADNPATGNGGTAGRPLTNNDVTFILNCGANCSSATFSNVSVQYGTSLSETNIVNPEVPEPT